jgi:WD40 repeat protein
MTGASEKLRNPYVGPRAFEEDERDLFFGRDEEIEILAGMVMARRAVLFLAQSGAGKSSLLRAGLIPELTRQETVGRGRRARTYQKLRVLPIVTVGGAISQRVQGSIANIYVYRVLLSLLPTADSDALASLSLSESLAPFFTASDTADQASLPPAVPSTLLVFDQFEELFTHDPTRRQEREDFFRQVREALDTYETLHVLFTMREDYVAELTPYAALLPEQLRPRFRLEFLGAEAARQAIQQPARRIGVDFGDAATTKLVDDLSRVRVQRLDGSTEEQAGPYVEPVQLQVVCRRLWEKLPEGTTEIVASDVEAVGDVDSALAGYYAEQVSAIAQETGIGERAIREWVDRHLITEQGIRGQSLQGRAESQGLDNRAIWPLVDAHLVRAEKRRGATWFELAHDRLIDPIRANNAAWWEANLSAVQRQATLWEAEGRPSGLLLRDQALVEAEAWASTHEQALTDMEREFLAECQEARAIAERERRQARRIRWLAVGATIFAIFAVVLAIAAVRQTRAANAASQQALEQASRARAGQLAFYAQTAAQDYPHRSILLLLESFKEQSEESLVPLTEQALRDTLGEVGGKPVPGHRGTVLAAAFSPDGYWLATGSRDETVRLWDVSALLDKDLQPGDPATEPHVLRGHVDDVRSVAFSPDGRWLATGSADTSIRLWDVSALLTLGDSGGLDTDLQAGDASVEPLVLRGHEDVVTSVAFSLDGHWLASGSWDHTIRLWDISAMPEVGLQAGDLTVEPLVLRGHEGRVWSVAFSPGGQWLASGSDDATVRLWDVPALASGGLAAGEPAALSRVLHAHEGAVLSLAFGPDGRHLATGSDDDTARLWDVPALTNEGQQVEEPAALLLLLRGHEGPVPSVAFSPDGQRLATGSDDATARLWDLRTTDPSAEPSVLRGHEAPVASVAFRPDGGWLATGSGDTTIRLWDLETEEVAAEPQVLQDHGGKVWSVAFSPDSRWLAAGSDDGSAGLWDVGAALAQRQVLRGHEAPLTSVTFSPDGRWLATGSWDTTVRLWDVATSLALSEANLSATDLQTDNPVDAVWVLRGHRSGVTSVAFSPDGRWLATGSDDATVRLWEVSALLAQNEGGGLNRGQQITDSAIDPSALLEHGDRVESVAFSPDGRWLATGSWDEIARLWDLAALLDNSAQAEEFTPKARELRGHENPVTSVAFSPDGRWLATGGGGWDDTVRLWDLELLFSMEAGAETAADEAQVLRGHAAAISSVAFSPIGRWLATGSLDDTARRWDLEDSLIPGPEGDEPTTESIVLSGHQGDVTSVAFSPDGRWLATSSLDTTVRLWRMQLDDLFAVACQVVGRNFMQGEWEQYFRGMDYRRTCEQLPAHYSMQR